MAEFSKDAITTAPFTLELEVMKMMNNLTQQTFGQEFNFKYSEMSNLIYTIANCSLWSFCNGLE